MLTILFLIAIVTLINPCPLNCQYCLQTTTCEACNRGYILIPNATCIIQTINNCRVQLNATHCYICEPTYQIGGKECIKDNSGCVIRNGLGKCEYCWFGTKLNQNVCTGIINCEIQSQLGKCSKCLPGYTLVGQTCIQNRQQCILKQSGICTKCISRHVLNGFSCLSQIVIPPYCSLFDYTVGRCLICNIGFQLYHRYCQRKDKIPFISRTITQTQPKVQNALAMQNDILSDFDQTFSPTNSDSITQDYLDIEINIQIGQGNTNKESCWQYGPNGICVVCFEGFYLQNRKCVKSTPQCLEFDLQGKLCRKCRSQLQLRSGKCLDLNCAVQIFSRCLKCLANSSPNIQGICVSQNCIVMVQGICTKCSLGYSLSQSNLCINPINTPNSPKSPSSPNSPNSNTPPPSVPAPVPAAPSIIGCDLIQNGVCVRCSINYYPNDKGKCKRVIIGCMKFDADQLSCIQCISIYYTPTSDGGCIQNLPKSIQNVTINAQNTVETIPSIDQNCQIKNNGSCAICKSRYVLNLFNFSCQSVPKECLTFNQKNGYCLSCINGFNLYSRWCLPKYSSSDPNCQNNQINNYCSTCKPQFYKSQGRCFPINTECKTFDAQGGDCLSCYSGYVVFNGQCIVLSKQPACAQYDFQQSCIKCLPRYYLQQSQCIPINPLCNNYNINTGVCIDCVIGYGLSSITNNCQPIQFAPSNCQKADEVGNCLICANRFFYNSTLNICSAILPLCSTYTERTGQCLSCYNGFTLLADNTCIGKNTAIGCLSATTTGSCSTCSSRYILTTKENCMVRDFNCITYDSEANCTNCRTNFYTANGKCVAEVKKAFKDVNCVRSNLNNYCIQCNIGFYIESGNCLLADQLCKSFDPNNGYCLTCYDGYRLNMHKCYLNNPIFNCKRFDGSVCGECESGFKVGSDGSCIKM